MYEQFYNLRERPFNLMPDPDFLYLSPQHKLARAHLEYGIRQRLGFVVLTGEVGTGKTTLIKSLIRARESDQRFGVLYQTSMTAGDLLDTLLREFEVRGHYPNRTAKLAAFNQFLLSAYSRSENVVLLVDEAQNLGPEALEEIRLLSNLQTEKEPLLQVILVGQPGLRDRLRHPSLRQLAQRVSVHYHLTPLNFQETKEYISFRLARAGGSGIFTESALEKLYQYSQGVPRRINAWCDLALVAGFAENRPEVDGEFIDTVVAAQGGSLEGEEATTSPSQEQVSLGSPVGAPLSTSSASSDGLGARISDLGSRITRLEGIVLDMTSQLMPIIGGADTGDLVCPVCGHYDREHASKEIRAAPAASDVEVISSPNNKLKDQERVKGQNRTMKIIIASLASILLIVASLWLLKTRMPWQGDTLELTALTIKDPSGHRLAWLGERGGQVQLELFDKDGKKRAALGLGNDEEPSLTLFDKDQKVLAELGKGPGSGTGPKLPALSKPLETPSRLASSKEEQKSKETEIFKPLSQTREERNAQVPEGKENSQEESGTSESAKKSAMFVANPNGKAYHLPDCPWVKNTPSEKLLKFSSAEEAEKAGFSPCRRCLKRATKK